MPTDDLLRRSRLIDNEVRVLKVRAGPQGGSPPCPQPDLRRPPGPPGLAPRPQALPCTPFRRAGESPAPPRRAPPPPPPPRARPPGRERLERRSSQRRRRRRRREVGGSRIREGLAVLGQGGRDRLDLDLSAAVRPVVAHGGETPGSAEHCCDDPLRRPPASASVSRSGCEFCTTCRTCRTCSTWFSSCPCSSLAFCVCRSTSATRKVTLGPSAKPVWFPGGGPGPPPGGRRLETSPSSSSSSTFPPASACGRRGKGGRPGGPGAHTLGGAARRSCWTPRSSLRERHDADAAGPARRTTSRGWGWSWPTTRRS